MTSEKQVALTIKFRGAQTSRGSYEYFLEKTENGIKEGIHTDRRPTFSQVTKQMVLKEQFIEGALQEPPSSMNMKVEIWKKLPENKRIGIHVCDLVKSMYPDRIGYLYEII